MKNILLATAVTNEKQHYCECMLLPYTRELNLAFISPPCCLLKLQRHCNDISHTHSASDFYMVLPNQNFSNNFAIMNRWKIYKQFVVLVVSYYNYLLHKKHTLGNVMLCTYVSLVGMRPHTIPVH
jgi:hypothetical protein